MGLGRERECEEESHDLQTVRKRRMLMGFEVKKVAMASNSSWGRSAHGGNRPMRNGEIGRAHV